MYRILNWFDRPHPILMLALLLFVSCGAFAAPRDIERIQWEGNRYVGRDYATVDALRFGKPLPPATKQWQLLEKDEPGNCTNFVAYKVTELEKEGYTAFVAVFPSGRVNHTVAVVKNQKGGFWVLDNLRGRVYHINTIPANWTVGSLEFAKRLFPY